VIDLDGVVWLAETPVAGSAESVEVLRSEGIRTLFVTNNAAPRVSALAQKLQGFGIEAEYEDIVTSSEAAASLLDPGDKAFVCGGAGINEALEARGVQIVGGAPADAVVVGWTNAFDFELLSASMKIVRSGARLIGTNADATRPVTEGLTPGAGAILAAVATASQREPEVAGKPHQAMADLVRRRVDDVTLVVGDRLDTDGLFAVRLGVPFALVHSGVTPAAHGKLRHEPDIEAEDLAGVLDRVLAR